MYLRVMHISMFTQVRKTHNYRRPNKTPGNPQFFVMQLNIRGDVRGFIRLR
jgi:hypothetical protein